MKDGYLQFEVCTVRLRKRFNHLKEFYFHLLSVKCPEFTEIRWFTFYSSWISECSSRAGLSLTAMWTCIAHTGYFVMSAVLLTFLRCPGFSRAMLLLTVPLNAVAEVNQQPALDLSSLSLLLLTVSLGTDWKPASNTNTTSPVFCMNVLISCLSRVQVTGWWIGCARASEGGRLSRCLWPRVTSWSHRSTKFQWVTRIRPRLHHRSESASVLFLLCSWSIWCREFYSLIPRDEMVGFLEPDDLLHQDSFLSGQIQYISHLFKLWNIYIRRNSFRVLLSVCCVQATWGCQWCLLLAGSRCSNPGSCN